MKESTKHRLCKDCVNFINSIEPDKVLCDMDHWNNTLINKAVIYVPELFECFDYENLDSFDNLED